MDITERKITKIAREAEMLVLRTLREEGVGTAEIDLIHALRHHPGCTQAALAELLHADKAAIARRTKNLETKGYLVRKDAPNDRRSQLLYPTERAESLKSSKAEIEAAFYEYLTSTLSKEEAAAFAAALQKLYTASKLESRAGFPHFQEASGSEAYDEAWKNVLPGQNRVLFPRRVAAAGLCDAFGPCLQHRPSCYAVV